MTSSSQPILLPVFGEFQILVFARILRLKFIIRASRILSRANDLSIAQAFGYLSIWLNSKLSNEAWHDIKGVELNESEEEMEREKISM